MNSAVELLTALCGHLAEFELPAMASVQVGAALSAPQVTVQLACHESSTTAQGLPARADTLTEVTAQDWRVPRVDSVHLSATGLSPGCAAVLVYGGLWATHRGLGADLALDATTTIPFPMLRHAAIVEEVQD
jgi:hypothetical protein